MTVRELIEKLNKMPNKDAEVWSDEGIWGSEEGKANDDVVVRIRTSGEFVSVQTIAELVAYRKKLVAAKP
ncbi:MAG: hypothetical protein WCC30_06745 [Candidatus Dormiibacterota bacterium]